MGPTEEGRVVVGLRCAFGATVVERLTVPLKPLVPVTCTVKVADDPLATVWVDGVTVSVKSAGGPVVLKTAV